MRTKDSIEICFPVPDLLEPLFVILAHYATAVLPNRGEDWLKVFHQMVCDPDDEEITREARRLLNEKEELPLSFSNNGRDGPVVSLDCFHAEPKSSRQIAQVTLRPVEPSMSEIARFRETLSLVRERDEPTPDERFLALWVGWHYRFPDDDNALERTDLVKRGISWNVHVIDIVNLVLTPFTDQYWLKDSGVLELPCRLSSSQDQSREGENLLLLHQLIRCAGNQLSTHYERHRGEEREFRQPICETAPPAWSGAQAVC